MGFWEDVGDFLGGAAATVIPGVKEANIVVDMITAIEDESDSCLLGKGDPSRCPDQLKAFKMPPAPKPRVVRGSGLDMGKKRNQAALAYLIGGEFNVRKPSPLQNAMGRLQQSYGMPPREIREKYVKLARGMSARESWFTQFGFKTITEVVDVVSQIVNRRLESGWDREELIQYEIAKEIRRRVNEMLVEMSNMTDEYRARGYIKDDDNGFFGSFADSFGGSIGRGLAPVKTMYALSREHIPGFAAKMDSYEEMFNMTKKGLRALDGFIAENNIPIVSQIRDHYANMLDTYKDIAKVIPGADEISKLLFNGKTVNEIDWIDIADTTAQMVNPVYGVGRAAMDLNKDMRESLERKPELTSNEFLLLVEQYMTDEIESMLSDSERGFDFGSLDVGLIEQEVAQQREREKAMPMINPVMGPPMGIAPTLTKTKVLAEAYTPVVKRPDVNVMQLCPVPAPKEPPRFDIEYRTADSVYAGLGGQKAAGEGGW